MEVDDATVVTADSAAPARLRHEYPFDLLVATRDRLADASFATPAITQGSGAVAMEDNFAVARAQSHLSGGSRRRPTPVLEKRYWRRGTRHRTYVRITARRRDRHNEAHGSLAQLVELRTFARKERQSGNRWLVGGCLLEPP